MKKKWKKYKLKWKCAFFFLLSSFSSFTCFGCDCDCSVLLYMCIAWLKCEISEQNVVFISFVHKFCLNINIRRQFIFLRREENKEKGLCSIFHVACDRFFVESSIEIEGMCVWIWFNPVSRKIICSDFIWFGLLSS